MSESRNKRLKRVYDLGDTLTPKEWAKAADVIFPDPNEGNGNIIKTTYKDLVNMISSGSLIPGALYEFDYNNYLPFKNKNVSDYYDHDIELTQYLSGSRVRVLALTPYTISENAFYKITQNAHGLNHSTFRNCKYSLKTPYRYNFVYKTLNYDPDEGWYENEWSYFDNIHKFTKDEFNYIINFINKYAKVSAKLKDEILASVEIFKSYIGIYCKDESTFVEKSYREIKYVAKYKFYPEIKRGFDYDRAVQQTISRGIECTKSYDEIISETKDDGVMIIYHPEESTGFVSDIQLDSGFLSYDITPLIGILGANVTFVGNPSEGHYVSEIGLLKDITIKNSYVSYLPLYYNDYMDAFLYNNPWRISADAYKDYYDYDPIFREISNSKVSYFEIDEGEIFALFSRFYLDNVRMPLSSMNRMILNPNWESECKIPYFQSIELHVPEESDEIHIVLTTATDNI